MASTSESKREGGCAGGRRHGPPTEEERQQRQAEFKQEFLDEYRKRYGDALISAEQTWELYQALDERRHAQMKERHSHRPHSPHHGPRHSPPPHHGSRHSPPPHHGDHSPPPRHGSPARFEEKRKQIFSELQQDFEKDFSAAHGTDKVNAEQAWLLIQKVQHNKHGKWEADRQKHGHRHGPGSHGRHSPPANQ